MSRQRWNIYVVPTSFELIPGKESNIYFHRYKRQREHLMEAIQ